MRMHATSDDFSVPDPVEVERAAALLRLLADPTRLKILHALRQGESFVGCLVELSGANQPTVSQHLTKLRLAGLITARREGTHTFYTLDDSRAVAVLDLLDIDQSSRSRSTVDT
jgi:DNA-binding transcriptional ArsR family regulator